MKKTIFLLAFTLFSLFGYTQTFFEGFENTTGPDPAPSTNWTLGSGNWAVFDNELQNSIIGWTVTENNFNPPIILFGNNSAFVNRENVGGGITSAEYLVTPAILVPNDGKLRFFARTFTFGNQFTYYQIRIASALQTQNSVFTFTEILKEYDEEEIVFDSATNTLNPYNLFTEQIVDIPSGYFGEEVFIAFVKFFTQPTAALGGDRWIIDNVSVTDNILNAETFQNTSFNVYPNPANTAIQIQLQNTIEKIDSITITDVLGKTIRNIKRISGNQFNVDVADVSQGVYFVEIITQNNLKQVKKLIKK